MVHLIYFICDKTLSWEAEKVYDLMAVFSTLHRLQVVNIADWLNPAEGAHT